MLEKPGYWEKYYHGDAEQQRVLRTYSYSDRVRYYWTDDEIGAAARSCSTICRPCAFPKIC